MNSGKSLITVARFWKYPPSFAESILQIKSIHIITNPIRTCVIRVASIPNSKEE